MVGILNHTRYRDHKRNIIKGYGLFLLCITTYRNTIKVRGGVMKPKKGLIFFFKFIVFMVVYVIANIVLISSATSPESNGVLNVIILVLLFIVLILTFVNALRLFLKHLRDEDKKRFQFIYFVNIFITGGFLAGVLLFYLMILIGSMALILPFIT